MPCEFLSLITTNNEEQHGLLQTKDLFPQQYSHKHTHDRGIKYMVNHDYQHVNTIFIRIGQMRSRTVINLTHTHTQRNATSRSTKKQVQSRNDQNSSLI